MKILPQRPYDQTLHESAGHYTLSFKNENMRVLKNLLAFLKVCLSSVVKVPSIEV